MVIPVPLGGLPIEVGPGHPYLSIGVRQRSFDWSIILASLSHPRPEVRANLLKCKPSRFLSVLHTSHLLNQLSVKAEALTVAAPCPGQAVHASLGGLFPAWTSSTLAHLCYSWKTVNSSVPAPLPLHYLAGLPSPVRFSSPPDTSQLCWFLPQPRNF